MQHAVDRGGGDAGEVREIDDAAAGGIHQKPSSDVIAMGRIGT
jgi:hypothetical protein